MSLTNDLLNNRPITQRLLSIIIAGIALGSSTLSYSQEKALIQVGLGAMTVNNPVPSSFEIGENNTVTHSDVFVLGSDITTSVDNSVYLGKGSVATSDKNQQTAGMTNYRPGQYAGSKPVGVVTIGSQGGERRIQNVAAGLVEAGSTDAINGSQLYQTNQDVAVNAENISNNTSNINKNTTAITNINNTLDKGINFAGNDGVSNTKLGETITISGGLADDKMSSNKNVRTVVNNGTVDIQIADRPEFEEVIVNQGLTVNQGANVNMGGNQVHHVADGTAPMDAVNVRQLQRVADRINDVDDSAAAGVAAAMATAALPQPYEPGKSMVGAAIGSYRDQQAVSIGLSTISDNGKWIIKGAVNSDTQNHFGASVGVGYQW